MNECFTHQPAFSKHILATDQNLVCTAPNSSGAQFPEEKNVGRVMRFIYFTRIILDFIVFFLFSFVF